MDRVPSTASSRCQRIGVEDSVASGLAAHWAKGSRRHECTASKPGSGACRTNIEGGTKIGEDAAELIHIGQSVIAHGGTVDYFTEAVISYPTLAECYTTAALDGINRLEM